MYDHNQPHPDDATLTNIPRMSIAQMLHWLHTHAVELTIEVQVVTR